MTKFRALFFAASVLLASTVGLAATSATVADTFKVTYFNAANTSGVTDDAQLVVTNPLSTSHNVAVYVFNNSEELQECCNCSLSPSDIRVFSVNSDLTANPLHSGTPPTTGPIYLVSNSAGDASAVTTSTLVSGGVRAFSTRLQQPESSAPTTIDVTAGDGLDAPLSTSELTTLTAACKGIEVDGSGHGICTCGTGE